MDVKPGKLVSLLSEDKYGEKCRFDVDCVEKPLGNSTVVCTDGFCRCKENVEIKYDDTLKPSCGRLPFHADIAYSPCNASSCEENTECPTDSNVSKRCRCREGFVWVKEKCTKVSYVKALERCYVTDVGEAVLCDLSAHAICSGEKCICFDNFYPNSTSGKCDPIADYLKSQNLTEYRVKPGEYCKHDFHCILGLECKNNKCQCPGFCTYVKEKEGCDCGPIELAVKDISGPITLGLILGALIVVFWTFLLRLTIRKHAKKSSASSANLDMVEETPGRTESYALSPTSPSSVPSTPPPSEHYFPANGTKGQALLPNGPPPPQASLYANNDPYPTAPSYSPSYSMTTSGTDIPPPYSPTPLPDGSATSSVPYPIHGGYLPYPTKPAVPNLSPASTGGHHYL